MKYLKNFNEKFNNSGVEEIKTIKEILLELDDIGYYTSVNYTPLTMTGRHENDEIYVNIISRLQPKAITTSDNYNKNFNKETEEFISRIKDYMKFRGWDFLTDYHDISQEISHQIVFRKKNEILESNVSYHNSRINFKGVKQMKESKVNTLEDKLAILKELSLPLMDAGLDVNITTDPERFHEKGIYVKIMDNDKIFCKNYPEVDELDWLVSKPIMKEYYEELNHFGLQYDRDYILYGGGLSATLFFSNKQSKAIKL